ncbi:MAG: hypothetical protein OEW45_01070, partial [Deltaproteobacteria bacterium]|nr:hypothetical protein [Deltaproteobacteria bacterium]
MASPHPHGSVTRKSRSKTHETAVVTAIARIPATIPIRLYSRADMPRRHSKATTKRKMKIPVASEY